MVVATPIGNPDDISARALRTLAEADRVVCEDTRRTGMLLARHGIRRPMLSYFEHNELRRTPEIIDRLRSGEKIALVSDAGTPCISDPGYRLVRAAHEAGIAIRAVPGASAAIAGLSISGLPTDRFAFEGFLPEREGARVAALKELSDEERTIVFYEAGRRLAGTLEALATVFGREREACVAREITKTWEETVRGNLSELAARFASGAQGEITIMVRGAEHNRRERKSPFPITMELLLEEGVSVRQASAIISRLTGRSRREIYQQAVKSRKPE